MCRLLISMNYRYTDDELKKLLNSLVIVIDTREKVNQHIIDYLDKKKVSYKHLKLNHGDYSVMLPSNEELGIMRDIYFPVSIERKNSIEELASTIKARTRFENELIRSQRSSFMVLIEDEQGYENIIRGNYRNGYNPYSFLASIKSFESRYNFTSVFVSKESSGNYIYHHLYYYVRELLINRR